MYQPGRAGKHCFVATATGETRPTPSIANKGPCDQEFKDGGEMVLKNAKSLGEVIRLGTLKSKFIVLQSIAREPCCLQSHPPSSTASNIVAKS